MDRENQPMNEDTRNSLRQCLPNLCECMQTTELVVWMKSKNVLTDFDVQRIEAKPTQFQKSYEIVTLLETKNQKAFNSFTESLRKTGQEHLARELLSKLADRTYAAELLRLCQPQCSNADTAQKRNIMGIQEALKAMYLERFKKINPFSLPFTFDIENTWVSLALRGEVKDMCQATARTPLPQSADQWGYAMQGSVQNYNYPQVAAGTSLPQSTHQWGYHWQAPLQDYNYSQATAGASLPQSADQLRYAMKGSVQNYNYPQVAAGTSLPQSADQWGHHWQAPVQYSNYSQATSMLLQQSADQWGYYGQAPVQNYNYPQMAEGTSLPQSIHQWGYYGQRFFQDYNYSQAATGTSVPQTVEWGYHGQAIQQDYNYPHATTGTSLSQSAEWGYYEQAPLQDYNYPQAAAGTSVPQSADQWGCQWQRPSQVCNYPQAVAGTSLSQSAELGYPMQTPLQDYSYSQATEDHAVLLKSAFEKEKMLIIEGKPATGKTSLMRRIAYEWAKGDQKLPHFDLVLYAEFRKVREKEYETIADLAIEYSKSSKKFFNSTELEHLEHILSNRDYCGKYRILLLLDGYDESSLHKQCKELHTYLTSSVLEFPLLFNVIVTTRPGYLGQHRGKQGRYTFADVLGFTTEEQKEKYILNHFASQSANKKQESIAAVHKLLRANENVNTLAETPLFLTFICLVHERIVDGTILELYCNIIWWLIDRHQKDFPDRDIPLLFEFSKGSSDKFRTIQNNYLQFPQLLHLGKMAFNNLRKDVFDESECVQYNLIEIIQQVGLLRKEEFYDQSFHLTTTFSFPHRTIKEFLAALYCMCSHEQFDRGFTPRFDTAEMKEYEKFFLRIALSDKIPVNEVIGTHYFDTIKYLFVEASCDALQTSDGLNFTFLNRLLSQCNNTSSLYIRNYIFETNSQFSIKKCAVLKELSLHECTIQRGTVLGIVQLKTIDTLELLDCDIDMEAWESIVEEIRKSSVKCLELLFMEKSFNNEYANQLQKCNNIIIKIRLDNYTIRSNDFLSFSGINLHLLTFSFCSFEGNSQISFKNCPAIGTLHFDDSDIDLETWKSVAEELRNTSVNCLKFSLNKLKYLESVHECIKIEEIFIVNDVYVGLQGYENDIVQQMIKLARNMQSLKRIVFDFSRYNAKLKDSNKELIEKAGQERDPNFTVTILSWKS